jgi:hypothetical protein
MSKCASTQAALDSFDRGVSAREDGCAARIIGQWSHGGR